MEQSDQILARSMRRHLLAALTVTFLLVGGAGGWAALTEISGAVMAGGSVVVDGSSKTVQHREGGIIREILVRNGDTVKTGDLLIRLDDTITKANLKVVLNQLGELYAQRARLLAERDKTDTIAFLPSQASQANDQNHAIEDAQIHLMKARRNSIEGRKQQLGEQMRQLEKQIEGLEAQREAVGTQIELIDSELGDLEGLLENQLVGKARITILKRDRAELEGAQGALIGQIAQAHEAISERKVQILQIEEQSRIEVLEKLQEVHSRIAQLEEQEIAARDQLERMDIRAPWSGFVHQLAVHTPGGVISPGQTLMLIVPKEDLLVLEARVNPNDINKLMLDQPARLRFPSFDRRSTPELNGKVKSISADLLHDEASGYSFYNIRIAITQSELSKLEGQSLIPGMPVEAFVTTGDRTVLSYLVKPVRDQIAHALKEK